MIKYSSMVPVVVVVSVTGRYVFVPIGIFYWKSFSVLMHNLTVKITALLYFIIYYYQYDTTHAAVLPSCFPIVLDCILKNDYLSTTVVAS